MEFWNGLIVTVLAVASLVHAIDMDGHAYLIIAVAYLFSSIFFMGSFVDEALGTADVNYRPVTLSLCLESTREHIHLAEHSRSSLGS